MDEQELSIAGSVTSEKVFSHNMDVESVSPDDLNALTPMPISPLDSVAVILCVAGAVMLAILAFWRIERRLRGIDAALRSEESEAIREAAKATEMEWRMWLVSFSSFGIGYTWGMQFSRATGLFKALGLSDAQLAMAFIPGSLIGIVVQPIVGVLSDNLQSYYGKRRPFIAGGAVLLVAGYGVVANSYAFGNMLGDSTDDRGPEDIRPAGAIICLTFFWVADFSINAAQLPCRVLATEVVPPYLQDVVMSRFSVADNAGKVCAYFLGAFSLANRAATLPGDTPFVSDVRVQFSLCCFWIAFSFTTVCIFVSEEDSRPLTKQQRRLVPNQPLQPDEAEAGKVSNRNAGSSSSSNDSNGASCSAMTASDSGWATTSSGCFTRRQFVANYGRIAGPAVWAAAPRASQEQRLAAAKRDRLVAAAAAAVAAAAHNEADSAAATPSAEGSDGNKDGRGGTDDDDDDDDDDNDENGEQLPSTSERIWEGLKSIKVKVSAMLHARGDDPLVPLLHCCCIDALAWFAWGTQGLWGLLYLGVEIYGGDPVAMVCGTDRFDTPSDAASSSASGNGALLNSTTSVLVHFAEGDLDPDACSPDWALRAAFEDGVHLFSFSFGLSCLVSLALSPCMPGLIHTFGNRAVWGASQLLLALCIAGMALLPSVSLPFEDPPPGVGGMLGRPKGMVAGLLIMLSGMSWGAKMTVPYAIVGRNYPGDGVVVAVLNCSLCVSNVAVALTTPFIVTLGGGKTSLALWLSSGMAFGAFLVCLQLEDTAGVVTSKSDKSHSNENSRRSSSSKNGNKPAVYSKLATEE